MTKTIINQYQRAASFPGLANMMFPPQAKQSTQATAMCEEGSAAGSENSRLFGIVMWKSNFVFYFCLSFLNLSQPEISEKMAKWGEGDPRWIVEERPDATNVNNWHWTEKNADQWSKAKIKVPRIF